MEEEEEENFVKNELYTDVSSYNILEHIDINDNFIEVNDTRNIVDYSISNVYVEDVETVDFSKSVKMVNLSNVNNVNTSITNIFSFIKNMYTYDFLRNLLLVNSNILLSIFIYKLY